MSPLPLPKPAAWAPLPDSTPIPLSDLTARTCNWPVGDAGGAQQMFCGLQVARNRFCSDHAARAYVKTIGDEEWQIAK